MYRAIIIIFLVIGIIIAFILIPGIGICILFYYLFYYSNTDINFPSDTVRLFEFLICICLAFPLQSIIYNFYILVYIISINYKYALIFFSSILFVFLIIYAIQSIFLLLVHHHHRQLWIEPIDFEMNEMDENNNNGGNVNV